MRLHFVCPDFLAGIWPPFLPCSFSGGLLVAGSPVLLFPAFRACWTCMCLSRFSWLGYCSSEASEMPPLYRKLLRSFSKALQVHSESQVHVHRSMHKVGLRSLRSLSEGCQRPRSSLSETPASQRQVSFLWVLNGSRIAT